MKKLCLCVTIVFLSATLFGQQAIDSADAEELYIKSLEYLADNETDKALKAFQELIDRYPNSEYAEKAKEYMSRLVQEEENNGIVTFYLGNLGTATYISMRLPQLFHIETDAVISGITGLIGVGTGLSSAWLMSRDYPISAARDWWIESIQTISMGNYLYLTGIFDFYELFGVQTANDILLGGQFATLAGSRIGSYFAFRDKNPSDGRAGFMINTYGWANAYYWLFTGGVLQSENTKMNALAGMVFTDLLTIGSLYLWKDIRWNTLRSGLVTVGGLGGGLIGMFGNMILDEIINDTRISMGILLTTALIGQGTATYLTRGFMPEKQKSALPQQDKRSKVSLSFFPLIENDAIGLAGSVRF